MVCSQLQPRFPIKRVDGKGRTGLALLSAVLACVGFGAWADGAPIYGGSTYNATTGDGFLVPTLPVEPGHTAGNGAAIGFTQSYQADVSKGFRAFRWDASGAPPIELENLGANSDGIVESYAYAINASGTTVGYSGKYEFGNYKGLRAVRWDAAGHVTELGDAGTDVIGHTLVYALRHQRRRHRGGIRTKIRGEHTEGL
jgi:hypothetical protein